MEVSALQTEAEAITLSAPWRAPLLSTSRKTESLKVSFPVKAVRVSPEGRFLASDGNTLSFHSDSSLTLTLWIQDRMCDSPGDVCE